MLDLFCLILWPLESADLLLMFLLIKVSVEGANQCKAGYKTLACSDQQTLIGWTVVDFALKTAVLLLLI